MQVTLPLKPETIGLNHTQSDWTTRCQAVALQSDNETLRLAWSEWHRGQLIGHTPTTGQFNRGGQRHRGVAVIANGVAKIQQAVRPQFAESRFNFYRSCPMISNYEL